MQRGLLRWFLSLHSPTHKITLSPLKLPGTGEDQTATGDTGKKSKTKKSAETDLLPALGQTSKAVEEREPPDNAGVSSIPPVPTLPETPAPRGKKGKAKAAAEYESDGDSDSGVLPTPFTPSINKTLYMAAKNAEIPPLPSGLSVSELKKRLDTKKKIKYVSSQLCA